MLGRAAREVEDIVFAKPLSPADESRITKKPRTMPGL
jgi:hypothetical protein